MTQDDDRAWRATFYTTGMEHSPTSATGTGWERTPWHAVQRAAWEALRAPFLPREDSTNDLCRKSTDQAGAGDKSESVETREE